MLTTLHLIVLALVQGLTEFLPISSSGHLILLPALTGWVDHGLSYDVAAHFGTLLAVVAYFRQDIKAITKAWLKQVFGGPSTAESRLAWGIGFGSIPVCVIGLLAHDLIANHLRSPLIIASTTIGFGIVLLFADKLGNRVREIDQIKFNDVILIGLAQALALIPGTSRSGITMSAGLALGLTRQAAARFSFLLAVPVIFLATGYEAFALIRGEQLIDWRGLTIVAFGSAFSAFLCITVFLSLLDRIGFTVFVVYRLVLGLLLIWLFV